MRIAIAVDGGQVSAHFGHCEGFMLYDIEGKQVADKQMLPNPGHRHGFLPGYLAERGINCIIAGGLGSNAQRLFNDNNITVITGVAGDSDAVAAGWLEGTLQPGDNSCDH